MWPSVNFSDVLRRPGIVVGRRDIQDVEVLEECLDVWFRILVQADALGVRPADGLVVHVGDVHHVHDPEPAELEEPLEEVFEDIGPEIADMGEIIDGRAAGVELDFARDEGRKRLYFAAQGVKELDHF